MNLQRHKKIIISGGGTGGHIFPAIAIADAVRRIDPGAEILFVGAEGRMEMEKVPLSGYAIEGLPVEGLKRKLTIRNFRVAINLVRSLIKASGIIKRFDPDVVVGVGGYASGPLLRQATRRGIPSILQEQNSFPGITNRLLASKASKICVAYEGMDKWFPAEKIVLTGNPLRRDYGDLTHLREEALAYFNLQGNRPVLFVTGGSLGAATINESLHGELELLLASGVQVLWQTGKSGVEKYYSTPEEGKNKALSMHRFIDRMDYAYSIADIIVARAGAITISELCSVGKPVILIPSPNVAEDHQTKNAQALVNKGAAIMVRDVDASGMLVKTILDLFDNKKARKSLAENISSLAIKNADVRIAELILKSV